VDNLTPTPGLYWGTINPRATEPSLIQIVGKPPYLKAYLHDTRTRDQPPIDLNDAGRCKLIEKINCPKLSSR
jgi:hypothetical protein